MEELVAYLARALVDNPDDVSVAVTSTDERDLYELSVASEDLGKVIGRQGRTARALRTMLRAAGAKTGRQSQLDILE